MRYESKHLKKRSSKRNRKVLSVIIIIVFIAALIAAFFLLRDFINKRNIEKPETTVAPTVVKTKETSSTAANTTITKETVSEETINPGQIERLKEFSININNEFIALLDWDDKIDLKKILGEPLEQETIQLGEGSDTFEGSYVKTLIYEGLEIKLFSPADNGKTFWIAEIIAKNPVYSDYKGIKAGDSYEKISEAYPLIEKVKDGRTDDKNCAYEHSDIDSLLFLQFEVSDGIIRRIRLFHEMP